ncbi:MAG TPA: translocation protein TolB [Candidatus Methylomirabilis sp.]|nr:translocation protein TolB [Candidatus Methylomirabilis sp.]
MVSSKRCRCLLTFAALCLLATCARAQEGQAPWIRTGTGLGVEKIRLAVSQFGPRADNAKTHAEQFTQIVRDDLAFSGVVDMLNPSFYPLAAPTQPGELNYAEWTDPQINVHYLAFGNISETTSEVAIQAWLYDVTSRSSQSVVGKIYRGAPTDAQVRKFAHQFADEIIMKLTNQPGVASTQIAFVSARTGTKEIWLMDYDGANQHLLTSLRTISLMPRWSPDTSRIAFTCYEPYNRIVSAQICMYSMDAGKVISFPRFPGSNSAPAWSPDGTQLMFSSSMHGTPDLYVSDINGAHPKRLTFSGVGGATSPTWNPKTGQSVVFVSDRGGIPKLYMMNADGSNVTPLDLPDKGYVIDPAWSPNGQILAFSWRRPDGNFDIYVMEPTSLQIINLTPDSGSRNERPSWAPDGRHIVFESTRTGTRQIWTMLADGSQARQLTYTGHNESPNWSSR